MEITSPLPETPESPAPTSGPDATAATPGPGSEFRYPPTGPDDEPADASGSGGSAGRGPTGPDDAPTGGGPWGHRSSPGRRLTRSRSDRVVAGVAGGLGQYLDIDPLLIRIAFVVLAVAGGSGVALYAAAWLLIAEDGDHRSIAEHAMRGRHGRRPHLLTFVLVGLGALALADTLRPWRGHGLFTPLVLIGLGVAVLYSSGRQHHGSSDVGSTDPYVPVFPPSVRPRGLTVFLLGGLAVLGGLAALIDLAGWAHVSLSGLLAAALVVTGVAVVAGAVRGRVGGLIVVAAILGVALAASLAVPTSLDDGVGNRVWQPASLAELRPTYRLGVGNAVLDLRDVVSSSTVNVQATVGVGHLLVIVPPTAGVVTHDRAGIGNTVVFDNREGGLSVDRTTADPRAGAVDVRLDLRIGIGQVEVERATA
jgi:phage shock protein PspC (stress-responsive transcriptional regulator)